MSVSKRRSEAIWIEKRRYWQVKVQRDGVRKAFTSSTPGRRGKHEAEAKADEWLESQTEDIRFFPAWDAYLADVKARCGTSHYGNVERNGRLHIKPVIKNVKLCSITVAAWKNCLQAAANAGLARASCASIRASITSFVEFAEDHRWRIESLPVRKLAIPRKAAPPKPKQALQPKDIRTLFTVSEVTLYGKPQPAAAIHAYCFLYGRHGPAPGRTMRPALGGLRRRHDLHPPQYQPLSGRNARQERQCRAQLPALQNCTRGACEATGGT